MSHTVKIPRWVLAETINILDGITSPSMLPVSRPVFDSVYDVLCEKMLTVELHDDYARLLHTEKLGGLATQRAYYHQRKHALSEPEF